MGVGGRRWCHNIIIAQTIKTWITSTFRNEFSNGGKCAVLILFHYLNIVLLSLCACVLFGLKKSRVFIIFIDAIINNWCLFVSARLQYACCVRVRVKIYTFDFFCLITLNAEEEKNEWQKYCLFAHSSCTTRLDIALSKYKKSERLLNFATIFHYSDDEKKNILIKYNIPEREREEQDMMLSGECVLKRNKWENFRQNWWQRQKKQLRINGRNKRNTTLQFGWNKFQWRRKIRFVSWKMSLFQWV